ncbi:hypothetical protein [Vibrio owensii]|nr:hypothetical protein [Vibrio owensii]
MNQSNVYDFTAAAKQKQAKQKNDEKERARQRILRAAAKIKW